MRAKEFIKENKSTGISKIVQDFVSSGIGKKYQRHDCKTVTRAFVKWASTNNISTQVLSLAPPHPDVVKKRSELRGKSGEGDGHIMPVVGGYALDFTARQFPGQAGYVYSNPLITPVSEVSTVYKKIGGYFTYAPDWFIVNGKPATHYLGPLESIPSDIFNQNFGDELLEGRRRNKKKAKFAYSGPGYWGGYYGSSEQSGGEGGVAEGSIKDLHMDLQDQQWDAIVGYVINGLKKNMDIGQMELNLYKYAGQEMFDVDQALEDHGFESIADLADHIQQNNGRYVPPTFNLGEQDLAEEVNTQIFLPIFRQQEKIITDKAGREYKLIAKPGPRELGQKFNSPSRLFTIEAYLIDRPVKVGWVNFVNQGDHLEAEDVVVEPKHRRRGLASAMYNYAKELGNDVSPSDKQTSLGKEFAKGYQYTETSENLSEQNDTNNDKAIILTNLPRYFKDGDPLEEFVPERKNVTYALHPEKFESTFYSLTLKDTNKLKYYRPKMVSIPAGTLVGDMALANKFYNAKTDLDKKLYANLYKESLKPYPVDLSNYRMPELLIPKNNIVDEDETLHYATEKTPATNPYGGLKDNQYRGAIAEAFDQPYPLTWEKGNFGDIDAHTTLPDGSPLHIMFVKEDIGLWSVEFYRSNTQDVSGEGDAQKIFATVLHAINKFVKKVKPKQITFSAVKENDPTGSRSSLYDRLVQRYASNSGYSVERHATAYKVSYDLIKQRKLKEASGYIPSEKEKNDPRFKTALTVDVHPNTMKKDAKKFGNKISRAGIPPTLRANGKF